MEVIVKSSPKIEIELATKVVKAGGGDVKADGVYPDLTAGDLAGRGESVPAEFGFRASGGKSIKDGRAYIKAIKGNSVVWNQKLRNSRIENADYWYSDRSNAEFNGQGVHIVATSEFSNLYQNARLILGRKYLLYASAKGNNGHRLNINLGGQDMHGGYLSDDYAPHYFFIQLNDLRSEVVQVYVVENDADWYVKECRLIDLTQMFGAGNEPSTIEEYNARKPIVADEYAYNEGEVIHCNTESIKSVGDNAWDEQWRLGFYIEGTFHESSSQIASANPIKVLPNQEYYINQDTLFYWWFYDEDMQYVGHIYTFGGVFKVPANAKYMHFNGEPDYGTTYKNDIMIRLDHSGWKSDIGVGYEPYWQDTLPLPIIRKYFPQGMKSAGSAHDEIRYNKENRKWEAVQRIASVDMGSLDWEVASNNRMIATSLENMLVKKDASNDTLLCAKYTNAYPSEVYLNTSDRIICSTNVGHIFVYDSAYTDAASFKAAMQGVMLYYELAEPIVTEITEDFRDYYQVADFGTEMSQSSVPSAPFSADIIYQFNAVDMIREHEAEITELQKVIETMQAQLTSLINGGQ